VYDGSRRDASTGAAALSVLGGDTVTLGTVWRLRLADENAGNGKTVTVSGLTSVALTRHLA
jgi:hypothetical protein